jgi:3-oxoacyl-[acyl-carrier protein] reductase
MKHVVVTGGSRGIGAAAVRLFAARGDRVWFFYEKSKEAAKALSKETGAAAIRCDVADEQAVRRAFAQLPDVDALVCSAGIAHYGLVSQITPAEWRRLFAVDVDGVFYCARAALPFFLQKQAGSIVNVASMWGQVGASCEAAYSAAKGAVIAFTRALAKELGPSGVRVNAVAPGVIDTDMCRCLGQETLDELKDQTPLGRLGTPEDVARAILYLSDADFVTGQILGVNGGFVI